MSVVVIEGMQGLGDNVYQRAYVRTLAARGDSIYLATPWPELYDDLGANFLFRATRLRTQDKNLSRQTGARWSQRPPAADRTFRVRYGSAAFRQGGSIPCAMEAGFGVAPAGWDLPPFPRFRRDRPIAVVRPVTERAEWHNPARNPLPEYVNSVAADLMATHHVISVADLVDGQEWLVGEAPPAHERFERGELRVSLLLGLIQSAAVVVGGVGWIVPACIAARTPLFVIHGGHGGHNARERITDLRMDLSHVRFAEPDRFCRCESMRHDACDKRNTRIAEQWTSFRRECGV